MEPITSSLWTKYCCNHGCGYIFKNLNVSNLCEQNDELRSGVFCCEMSCGLFPAHRWWMSQKLVLCLEAWPASRDSLKTKSLPHHPPSPASPRFILSRDMCRWERSRSPWDLLMNTSGLNLLAYQQIFDWSHLPGSTQWGHAACGTSIQSVNKMPEWIKESRMGLGLGNGRSALAWYLLIQAISWADSLGAQGPCWMLNFTWTFVRGRWCCIRFFAVHAVTAEYVALRFPLQVWQCWFETACTSKKRHSSDIRTGHLLPASSPSYE